MNSYQKSFPGPSSGRHPIAAASGQSHASSCDTVCDGSLTIEPVNEPNDPLDIDHEHYNDRCIRLAARCACEQACAATEHYRSDPSGSNIRSNPGRQIPCIMHLREAFEKYGGLLESSGCICHEIRGAGPPITSAEGEPVMRVSENGSQRTHCQSCTCPDIEQRSASRRRRSGRRLRWPWAYGHSRRDRSRLAEEARQGLHTRPSPDETNQSIGLVSLDSVGPSKSVSLVVQGMTCSDCSNKLTQALRAVPGVTQVHVSFVMGSADFHVNESVTPIADAVRTAETTTGYHCTPRVGHQVDILLSRRGVERAQQASIAGLQQINSLSTTIARVVYEPRVIGARDLLDKVGSVSLALASPSNPYLQSSQKDAKNKLRNVIAAAVLSLPVAVLAWGHITIEERTKAVISIGLATAVQVIAIPEFYIPALLVLFRRGALDMKLLVVISITAAYVYSTVAFVFRMLGHPLDTPEFFETSTLLITFVLFGQLIAAWVRVRAVGAVSTRTSQPSIALLSEDTQDREIDARLLQFNDRFKLLPHTRAPTDGQVVSGSGDVDESILTGESMPVHKSEGMMIKAGTVNGNRTIIAKVLRLPESNSLTDIAGLVEKASESKTELQNLADRVARYFIPVVSAAAVVTFLVWTIVGLVVRKKSGAEAVATAITYAVGVLAISCPCALGLAVPMVLFNAFALAARKGVVIKTGEAAERAHGVTDVVFDKTGTLTGEIFVSSFRDMTYKGEGLAIAKALVGENNHPVSIAACQYLEAQNIEPAELTNAFVVGGAGVIGVLGSSVVKARSPKWTMTENDPTVSPALLEGHTVLSVTRDDKLVAALYLRTRMRGEALQVMQELARRDIELHLVSGDQKYAVRAAALEVGIPLDNIAFGYTAQQKAKYVSDLQSRGKLVMFCGDGTNDAVAVATARVGVQMGGTETSSDITRSAADVVLLSNLKGIVLMLDISKAAYRRIIFNFVWAGVYNVVAILLAAGAFVRFAIPPAYAGLGELVSVLPVIAVAMSLLLKRSLRPRK